MTTGIMSLRFSHVYIEEDGGGCDTDGSVVLGDEFLPTSKIRGMRGSLYTATQEKPLRPGIFPSYCFVTDLKIDCQKRNFKNR